MDDVTKIDDNAAAWVVREDKGPLDPASMEQRDQWLAADKRHHGAYVRAHAVFLRAGRASALGRGFGKGAGAQRQAGSWARRGWMSVAAVVLLAVAGLGLQHVLMEVDKTDYMTGLGEVLRVPLADGSVMTLNSGTEARVSYREKERRVTLIKGEILVDVAKDASRPFMVKTGETDVVAVGTSFSVRKKTDEAFEVLVNEGIVDIRQSQPGLKPLRVRANHAVVASRGSEVSVRSLDEEVVHRRLAWREGLIFFEGDSLADAAIEFSRYSDVRILIEDPQVAERRVVGVYSSADPEGFAKAVADSLGLKAETAPEGVYLRALY